MNASNLENNITFDNKGNNMIEALIKDGLT